jgi:hypothetical protein
MRTRRTSKLGTTVAALALVLLVCAGRQTPALDRGTFSLDVLVDGVPLTEYRHRDRTYVEAQEEREYSLRLTNRTARRVAVALSVDGLNTIDAKSTTAGEASKWIIGPWETITLQGWQVGVEDARKFFFTTEEKSYGAWLGKTRNLGVISAAVFRERLPEPVPTWSRRIEKEEAYPSAPSRADRDRNSRGQAEAKSQQAGELAPEPADDMAATGIGRKYGHRVRRVEFEADGAPPAMLELRYEYRDALIRLGALPAPCPRWEDPLKRRERAHGFEDLDFAPDPYQGR